jgi:hypothetical protein
MGYKVSVQNKSTYQVDSSLTGYHINCKTTHKILDLNISTIFLLLIAYLNEYAKYVEFYKYLYLKKLN